LRAECFAVYVAPRVDLSDLPAERRETVEKHLNFARNLHIETRVLQSQNIAETLVDFAHRNQVTQVFLTRSGRSLLPATSLVSKVLRLASDLQVTVVAERKKRI
ncbi:MAG TPA: histidine kinase, partial [Terriglobia bacterium]|nr:histidine kinase [Terriglobia bacterium]